MRGLLTDFGGVLTTNVFDSFRAFATAEGLPRDTVKRTFRENPEALAELRLLESGQLSVPDFERRFAPHLGIEEHSGLVERLFAGLGPDEPMMEAMRRAHDAGIKTAVISNSWGDGIYDGVELGGIFDELVISGEVGLHKPDPAIFELTCGRLGVVPSECVFVDDLRENCAAAEELGMTAILHRGADSTLPELERLLELRLR
ncbi:MAG TPA: HAD family phosphatase [Thermoleophilaceae bacterium]|nr:HAD family phosphatase [Thermoleophilaceae bacterium]